MEYTRQAVEIRQGLAQHNPEEANLQLAMSLHNRSEYAFWLGEYKDSVKYAQQASDFYRDLSEQEPDDAETRRCFPGSLFFAARSLEKLGDHEGVVRFGREAIANFRNLVHDRPKERRYLIKCIEWLAPSLAILGFADEAVQATQELERERRKESEASQ